MKVTVFLADTEDRPAFNEVYAGYVDEPYLARTAVGVDLAVDTGAEVKVVVAID